MAQIESLADLLADAGIRLKTQKPAHTEHIRCPRCGGGNSREVSLAVTVDDDGEGATYVCHRGSCGWRGGGRIGSGRGLERERPVSVPAPHSDAQRANRPDWLHEFFASRKIGPRVIRDLGIYAVTRRFADPIGESPAIVFPYVWKGEVCNRKYRPYPAKNPMQQERDALPTLFNIDSLGTDPQEIIFVEGEMDVAALMECGVRHVVTLKDGAPKEATFKPEDRRFEALRTHSDILRRVKRIVLAGDTDSAGTALLAELARRLGRHRCRLAEWPRGCKDAGETLLQHGPDAVLGILAEAAPYPIEGLRSTYGGTLLSLQQTRPPAVMSTGADASDRVLSLPTEGRLIVVTGWPSSGKTAWTRYIMVHTATHHDRRWCAFSPEMQPWEQFIAACAEVVIGKPFWPRDGRETMNMQDVMRAESWLTDRIVMMVNDAEDEPPTLDWVLEHARMAILRDGITDLLIDPWNELDHTRLTGVTETEYIGRALQRLKSFALRHGCNVWIIAHPAKPMATKAGERRGAPGPYDISGSAHWANKTDLGITVHVNVKDMTTLSVWKARHRRWAARDAVADLAFDEPTGRYAPPKDPDGQSAFDEGRWGE
jgi:twinkle protein